MAKVRMRCSHDNENNLAVSTQVGGGFLQVVELAHTTPSQLWADPWFLDRPHKNFRCTDQELLRNRKVTRQPLGHENGVVSGFAVHRPENRAFRELRARPPSHETGIVQLFFIFWAAFIIFRCTGWSFFARQSCYTMKTMLTKREAEWHGTWAYKKGFPPTSSIVPFTHRSTRPQDTALDVRKLQTLIRLWIFSEQWVATQSSVCYTYRLCRVYADICLVLGNAYWDWDLGIC